ncbi:MAG: DUF2892 domain-containing protein [Spirochaetia bacterium]|nr:DUF2892 domain-containing protein [Spirochaetia bacterium]
MNTIGEEIRKTMGSRERLIRIAAGFMLVGIGLFYFGGKNGELMGVTIALIGLLPLTTGFINYCPLYGVRGRKSKKTSR